MKKLLLLSAIILTSCTAQIEPTMHETYFNAAYPPYSCNDLNPVICNITIDGVEYSLSVTEVKGGMRTEKILIEEGLHYVSKVEVFDAKGNLTHFMADGFDDKGWVVIHLGEPMPIMVDENNPWISGQLFCNGFLN